MGQTLQELGLGEYESKVYVALLRHGPQKAKPLSERSGVPQSKIYEVLARLEERHFVALVTLRPKCFRAIEPKEAVRTFVDSTISRLEESQKRAIRELQQIKAAPSETQKTDELISLVRGRAASLSIIQNRYRTAHKYIKEMFTFEFVPESLFREIDRARHRGVEIRMLATKRGDLQQKLINRAKALGVKVRYYPISQLRLAIKDGIESAQTIVNPNDLTDRTTIVIASIELTRALEQYFDVVWKKAELM